MKYGILENITDLAKCSLATVTIAKNPLQILKKNDYTSLRLIGIEEEAPEGTFYCKLEEGKLQTCNGNYYGYVVFDLSKHLIEFEPDSTYECFGSGYAREVKNVLKPASYESNDSGFLIFSEEEGPSAWTKAIINSYESLDFGIVIPIKCLL